jgi:SAM-dependent methyltransferase
MEEKPPPIQIAKLKVLTQLLPDFRFGKFALLDIGGTKHYRSILQQVFPNAEIFILNVDDNVESKPSIRGDATELPFKDETWDLVTSFDTLEHLIYPDKFLCECFRILKNGAYFILSTPNLAAFLSRVVFPLGYTPFLYEPSRYLVGRIDGNFEDLFKWKPRYKRHLSVFTYKGLVDLLHLHGFTILKSAGYPYTDRFYFEKDLEERGEAPRSCKLPRSYIFRNTLNAVLPTSMKEGLLFVCQKNP